MTTLLLTLTAALAAGPGDPDWTTACQKVCERTGFKIEVLESTTGDSSKLRLWDITAHEWIDDAHYQTGDLYVGEQSGPDSLAGGPYCTSYPGAGGHLITGSVWDREIHYDWEVEETGQLLQSAMVFCDADFPHLLTTLQVYGINGTDLPSSCTDLECASGDGIDPEDPGTGSWGYTDAAGSDQSFDDLVDGGEEPVAPTLEPADTARRR